MEWESDSSYEPSSDFECIFTCLPFSKYKFPNLETGDKIIMPPSSLSLIVDAGLNYPLLFQIESYNDESISHCGVLEFQAEEGFVHVPEWMMRNLNLQEGDLVIIRGATISKGRYMKLQPHATSFIELSNPKAVLEQALRSFTCLTSGDTFVVKYNGIEFCIDVLEVRPGDAICLIDTDCEVDFAAPLDYKEIEKVEIKGDDKSEKIDQRVVIGKEEGKGFRAFMGKGRRLDGEAVAVAESGGCAAVVEGLAKVVISEKKEKFKAFTGKSYYIGGS